MSNNKMEKYFKKISAENRADSTLEIPPGTSNDQTSLPMSSPTKVLKVNLISTDDLPAERYPSLQRSIVNQESTNELPIERDPSLLRSIVSPTSIDPIDRDPGLRKSIWSYPADKRNDIRRAYILAGPYQFIPNTHSVVVNKHGRKFLPIWYTLFPDWLEYSPSKNAAFCLPCFLFVKPSTHFGSGAFNIDGFQAWKKVNNGSNCAFIVHEGKRPNSYHKVAVKCAHDLMNPLQHIENIIDKQSSDQVSKNRLRLQVSIDAVRFYSFQGIAFRGHDERALSQNRGNFLEIVKHTACYNEDVNSIVLGNAPQNAAYTSPQIQKEILSLYVSKIQRYVREEICGAKYCIIVDESRDESKREQMAIVLRFVDKDGFIRERFFDIVHVEDTKASTLKKEICNVLSRNNLSLQDMRGQGYDGASTMRGEWNGLQALFQNECPYAYYVHCFAHRLQLILVATAQGVIPIENFISQLLVIVNLVDSSAKRHDQLHIAQSIQIEELTSASELETGSGKNQIQNIQRPGDTRWGSHLKSLRSVHKLFDPVLHVLSEIINDKGSVAAKAAADGAYDLMTSFDFVFILHFMIELLGITDDLCRILQYQSQDILNAMGAFADTKELVEKVRKDGWHTLFDKVKSFCQTKNIEVPDMDSIRRTGRGRINKKDPVKLEHHYRIDIFNETLDSIVHEMNYRFDEKAIELLTLSAALDPRNKFNSFNIDDMCKLVEKFYPNDFTDQEKMHMKYQLQLFELDIHRAPVFQNLSTLSELCQRLSETGKKTTYHLVDRLIRLILTLPVSSATSERAFSAMKFVKTRLRNKMEDKYLASSLIMYIEKEIAQTFDVNSIIDEFEVMKKRRVQFTESKYNKEA